MTFGIVTMLIGVPKEIKDSEYRVGLVPSTVRELTRNGHHVIVERRAGLGAGITDDDYRAVAAEIVSDADQVFGRGELIVKVKEPLPVERKARRGERGGPQRVPVDARVHLLQALGLAAERRFERGKVVRERRGLRLHPVGVGGDDGFRVPASEGEELLARGDQRLAHPGESVAQVHARNRRRDVLAASPGVQPRGIRTHNCSEPGFVVEIVG